MTKERSKWIERHKKGRLCAYKFIKDFILDEPDITIGEIKEILNDLIEDLEWELEIEK